MGNQQVSSMHNTLITSINRCDDYFDVVVNYMCNGKYIESISKIIKKYYGRKLYPLNAEILNNDAIKIVLVGTSAVGKTTLLTTYDRGSYNSDAGYLRYFDLISKKSLIFSFFLVVMIVMAVYENFVFERYQ